MMLLAAVISWPAMQVFGQTQRVTMYFTDANGNRVSQMTATIGEEFVEPTVVVIPDGTGGRVVYESSDENVAYADMMSGEVTLYAAGTTTITATFGGTEEYAVSRTSYQLTVVAPQDTTPAIEPTCPEAHYNLNGAEVMTLHVGDVVSIPSLLGATGSILPLSAKTIEGILVAELTEDDMIHATGVGTATFIGLYMYGSADGSGQTLECTYSFSIVVEAAAPTKQSPELSWSDTTVYAELGVPCEAPILYNPHNVPMNKIESQNPNVAEVSEDGTQLTIKGVGDALIFAESFETSEYYAQSVSYIVHVSTIGLRVKGINVTSLNAEDVLGDGSHNVTFEVESRTLHLNSWNIDGANLSFDAMIKDEGVEHPLTIMLHGVNSITNVQTCILAANIPVIVMGQSMRDALALSASQVAVNTPYFKIHQCDVSADAPTAAIKLGNELGVSKNSHLLATSTGLAIQCKTLVMAEGEEGVAILTPGVHFEMNKGFFTENKQYAKEVEIGKVPVVAPADEVTTIDFTATDPEGNETVVFSASADDTYNEETGQLELATSLTDEAVAQALEDLVPGSSAWIDLLPGSLVFDIPAGQGTVRVQCLTLAGYTLQVKKEGEAVVSIAQTTLGWAEVTYNVPAPIHVVIYLHASAQASAPARIATRMEDAVSAGAYIQAVQIVPADAPVDPTAIVTIEQTREGAQKILRHGELYILRGEKTYTVQGQEK